MNDRDVTKDATRLVNLRPLEINYYELPYILALKHAPQLEICMQDLEVLNGLGRPIELFSDDQLVCDSFPLQAVREPDGRSFGNYDVPMSRKLYPKENTTHSVDTDGLIMLSSRKVVTSLVHTHPYSTPNWIIKLWACVITGAINWRKRSQESPFSWY